MAPQWPSRWMKYIRPHADAPRNSLSRWAQTSAGVSEDQYLDAQDSDNPHATLVDLLVDVGVKAQLTAEQTDAALRVQSYYRGYQGRKEYERARAQALLSKEKTEEDAKAELNLNSKA